MSQILWIDHSQHNPRPAPAQPGRMACTVFRAGLEWSSHLGMSGFPPLTYAKPQPSLWGYLYLCQLFSLHKSKTAVLGSKGQEQYSKCCCCCQSHNPPGTNPPSPSPETSPPYHLPIILSHNLYHLVQQLPVLAGAGIGDSADKPVHTIVAALLASKSPQTCLTAHLQHSRVSAGGLCTGFLHGGGGLMQCIFCCIIPGEVLMSQVFQHHIQFNTQILELGCSPLLTHLMGKPRWNKWDWHLDRHAVDQGVYLHTANHSWIGSCISFIKR